MVTRVSEDAARALDMLAPWFSLFDPRTRYDNDRSVAIIAHGLPLLDTLLGRTLASLAQYLAGHQRQIRQSIRAYASDTTSRYALLAQPAGLLLCYLLDRDARALRTRWAARWPLALLDTVADIWDYPDPAASAPSSETPPALS